MKISDELRLIAYLMLLHSLVGCSLATKNSKNPNAEAITTLRSVKPNDDNTMLHTHRLIDKTYNMEMSIFMLPSGFSISQNIKTNHRNIYNYFSEYSVHINGNSGEYIFYDKPVGFVGYSSQYENVWRDRMNLAYPGAVIGSQEKCHECFNYMDLVNDGQSVSTVFKRDIEFFDNNQRYIGVSFAIVNSYANSHVLSMKIVLSPSEVAGRALEAFRIMESTMSKNHFYHRFANEQITNHRNQILQSNAAFMNDQRRHYTSMQGMINQRRAPRSSISSSISSSSSYGVSSAINDNLRGTTSFEDPHYGHVINEFGHYDRWFTDGSGNYHGTNDPTFEPIRDLGANWGATSPMSL